MKNQGQGPGRDVTTNPDNGRTGGSVGDPVGRERRSWLLSSRRLAEGLSHKEGTEGDEKREEGNLVPERVRFHIFCPDSTASNQEPGRGDQEFGPKGDLRPGPRRPADKGQGRKGRRTKARSSGAAGKPEAKPNGAEGRPEAETRTRPRETEARSIPAKKASFRGGRVPRYKGSKAQGPKQRRTYTRNLPT